MDKYDQAAFDPSIQYWQAGKGVDSIQKIQSCKDIMAEFESGFVGLTEAEDRLKQSKL